MNARRTIPTAVLSALIASSFAPVADAQESERGGLQVVAKISGDPRYIQGENDSTMRFDWTISVRNATNETMHDVVLRNDHIVRDEVRTIPEIVTSYASDSRHHEIVGDLAPGETRDLTVSYTDDVNVMTMSRGDAHGFIPGKSNITAQIGLVSAATTGGKDLPAPAPDTVQDNDDLASDADSTDIAWAPVKHLEDE